MKRREFITLLGGAAAAWPVAARAQQGERMRRIGVLMTRAADDPDRAGSHRGVPAGAGAIGLDDRPQRADRHPLGAGRCRPIFASMRRNWSRSRRTSLLATGTAVVGALQQATRTVPIVFASCRRSGWRRLCREPGAAGRQRHRLYLVRIRHEREMAGIAQGDRARRDASRQFFGMLPQPPGSASSAQSRPWRLVRRGGEPINVRDAGEIERAVTAFARAPNGGLIVTASPLATLIAN